MRLLHRHVLLPAFETVYHRRKTFGYLRELEKTQWLSRWEIEQRQLESLRALLMHAWEQCPYYRQTWEAAGCDPRKLDSLTELQRWPTINRESITRNRAQMQSRVFTNELISKATGGSSGEPLRFDLNLDSNDRRNAMSARGYGWAGAALGVKMLYLWGVPLGRQPWRKRVKDSLYYWLYRRKILNCFELSDERVPEFLEAHNRYRGDVIVAYTNPLYEFARALEERGLRPHSPKAILTGAEKLHPFQRERIERVFGAPVFETYGSREFMLISSECDQHAGLHLSHENMIVEVLEDDGTPTPAGREGNVVITDLYNYGMPFIRYCNGDRAVAGWTMCKCGRGLPLMQPPLGRTLDVLTTPDGRRVPGELFPHMMKDYAAVRRFQVVQEAPDLVEIRVVAGNDWNEASRQAIELIVRETMGPLVHVELKRVDDIPLTGTGKLRVVVNKCGQEPKEAQACAS